MSVLGTGVAAGVAQSALQAQQTARRRDRRQTQSEAEAERVRDLVEAHLRAVEEGDQSESPAQLHIDGQVPEHQGAQAQAEDQAEHSPAPRGDDEDDHDQALSDRPATPAHDSRLYRHLDVQA